jgi:cytochrome c556
MKRILMAASVLVLGLGAVAAQSDPIATRRQTMKAVGDGYYRDMGKINKGEAPYDQAKVEAALKRIAAAAKTLPSLYPDTAKSGEDSIARPQIWENKADFESRYAKLGEEAEAQLAKVKDVATLKAAYSEIGKTCNGCHELYRAKTH